MRAIELLAFGAQSAPQVAAALQIHPRTARRLLERLLEEEYVTRSDGPARRYALSMRLAALASQVLCRAELPQLAAPFVEMLQRQTGGTAHLFVPSYDRSVSSTTTPVRPLRRRRSASWCHVTAPRRARHC